MANFDLQRANVDEHGDFDFDDDDVGDKRWRRTDYVEDGGTFDPIQDAALQHQHQHQQRKAKRILKQNKAVSVKPKVDDDKDEAESNEDESESGEAAKDLQYDENAVNAASELDLLHLDESSGNKKLLFFQLPQSLPFVKHAATAEGKEVGTSAGHKGKMIVYSSGTVKLKLGDTLFDVTPGSSSDCSSAQEVVVINKKEKECCSVGELAKRAIVTPDVDHILDNFVD